MTFHRMLSRLRSSMSALKLGVERCLHMPPNCESMRTLTVSYFTPEENTILECMDAYIQKNGHVIFFLTFLLEFSLSAVKLDAVEAFCGEPSCMKFFTNEQCLMEHVRSYHQYITCETCGTRQLKKNIKRHLRSHEAECSQANVKCTFDGCLHSFLNVGGHSPCILFSLCYVNGITKSVIEGILR